MVIHRDPDIQKNAAETIWRLLEEPANLPLFAKKEYMESILELTDSEYPAVQIVGLSVLEKITTLQEGAMIFFGIHGVQNIGQVNSLLCIFIAV